MSPRPERTRTEARHHLEHHVRLDLLEEDADEAENAVDRLREWAGGEMSELRRSISRMTWALVSAALSMAISSVLLIVTIVATQGG